MNVRTLGAVAAMTFALGLLPSNSYGSDHIDGDVTKKHPISDLTDLYAFPTPGKPGFLTLVLNVHPFAVKANHFSEKVDYNLVLREAVTDTEQGSVETDASSERILHCTFDSRSDPHTMTCSALGGSSSSSSRSSQTVVFEETNSSSYGGLRLFAGHRADSFFFSAPWAGITAGGGVIAPADKGGTNSMNDLNTLSIVIDVDVRKLFGKEVSLLAVVAESINTKTGARLDRVGRPEVTNVTMVAHKGDTDLRDGYNTRAFDLSEKAKSDYYQRIVKNIGYYDALDGKTNWTNAQSQRYAKLIVDDFLLVDVSLPAGEEGYFTIESALLEGRPRTTAGGRLLTDDIMDMLFTTLINNSQGERISDGVYSPATAPTAGFPYLGKPNLTVPAKIKAEFGRKLSGIPDGAYKDHADEHQKKEALKGMIQSVRGHTSKKQLKEKQRKRHSAHRRSHK